MRKWFLPAIGVPTVAAIPWNNIRNPKAFVSFSRPIISTAIKDLKAEKHAMQNPNSTAKVH